MAKTVGTTVLVTLARNLYVYMYVYVPWLLSSHAENLLRCYKIARKRLLEMNVDGHRWR